MREHLAARLAEATSAHQSLIEQLAAYQQHLADAEIAQASLEQWVAQVVAHFRVKGSLDEGFLEVPHQGIDAFVGHRSRYHLIKKFLRYLW